MGFNISGIVINKNFQNNIGELAEQFKWSLDYVEEIDFETASKNWKDEDICDIYFSKKGTFIFINMDDCLKPFKFKNRNILTFVLSEISMVFNLNYTENEKNIRSIIEYNGELLTDEGEKLNVEIEDDDTSEIIWKQIEVVLGESFWKIQPEEKCFRYKYSKIPETKAKTTIDYSIVQSIIKGQTEYCHILPPEPTLIFTKNGKIENLKSNNNSSLASRLNEIITIIIPTTLLIFSFYNFHYGNYIISIILGILGLYFLYSFLMIRNLSNDNVIKKDKIKQVRHINKENLNHSGFEIVFINQKGKTKKRHFILEGKLNDGSNIAENALEIMKKNGLIE